MSFHVSRLSGLKEHLNTELAVTDYIRVDQDRITDFARVTDDWQWIHTDVERAVRESPFGGPVAHGFLVLSLLSHFLASTVRVDEARLLVSCGLASVRFVSPILAGSRVRARIRLRQCADGDGFVEATWRFTIECQGQRHAACFADWAVRYYA